MQQTQAASVSRIPLAELETEGHRGHAMEVLKANAIDMAQKIDELRGLLAEPAKGKG